MISPSHVPPGAATILAGYRSWHLQFARRIGEFRRGGTGEAGRDGHPRIALYARARWATRARGHRRAPLPRRCRLGARRLLRRRRVLRPERLPHHRACCSASGRRPAHIDLKAFWFRRARRLLPAMALVLAGVALYAAWAANPVELAQLRTDGLSTLFYVANWNQIISHQSYFEQFAAPSALRHTWSLAIEEQFYLLWPLVMLRGAAAAHHAARPPRRLRGARAGASALLMGLLYQPGHDPSRVYYGTDTRAQSLLIGAMLAVVLSGRQRRRDAHAPHRVCTARRSRQRSGSAVIWTTTAESDGWQYRGGFALAAVLVTVVIAGVTLPGHAGPLGSCSRARRCARSGSSPTACTSGTGPSTST